MKKRFWGTRLRLMGAALCGLLLPLVGLIAGAFSGVGADLGTVAGAAVGLGLYLWLARVELNLRRNRAGLIGPLAVAAVFYLVASISGMVRPSITLLVSCYIVLLGTLLPALYTLKSALRMEPFSPAGAGSGVPTAPTRGAAARQWLVVVLLLVAAAGLWLGMDLVRRNLSPTPEEEAAAYAAANPTYSAHNITFDIDSGWTPLEDREGMFLSEDGRAVFGLNAVTQLGAQTPETAYEELMTYYQSKYEVENYPVLAQFTSPDGVLCYSGDIKAQLDENTYAFLKAVFVPQKNLMVTLVGQRGTANETCDVEGPVRNMMFSLTFQVGMEDEVSGNTFIAEGDGSELCLKGDGSYFYYASAADHSQRYYAGSYEVFRGQSAVDKAASLTEYGLTAEELEQTLMADMDGYAVGGPSLADIQNALVPGSTAGGQTYYQVCKDTFYAVLLHNERLVLAPGEVQEGGNTTLYLGYYIPELELADLVNANAASRTQWQRTGPTDELDAEPRA